MAVGTTGVASLRGSERRRVRIRSSCAAAGLAWVAAAVWAVGACAESGGASPAVLAPCFPLAVREVARCGTVWVFEDRERGAGRQIGLRVIVLPARARAAPDPVVYLTGGPGLGAASSPGYALRALAGIRDTRDVVLVDQRGTGGSHALDCDLYAAAGRLEPYAGTSFPIAGVRRCADVLRRRADLAWYTTEIAADDLNQVLTAMGYGRVNLLGVSYGSRAALVFIRRYGERVRAAVLHGVVPPDALIPLAAGRAGAHAFDAQVAACAADAACRDSFPDPADDLRAVLAGLRHSPARVSLWNWRRLQPEDVTLTARGVAERAWAMLYRPTSGRRLVSLVHRARAGDWAPFARVAIRGRTSRQSAGLLLSVLCAEDAPRLGRADTAGAAAGSLFGLPIAHELLQACTAWPGQSAGRAVDTSAVRSDVPILLLSGALDSVTPPDWADSAQRTLPNSVHLVAPRAGHAELDACTREAIEAFLRAADARLVRTACE